MVLNENKERLLDEWLAVRNSIMRASEGQMRVTYKYSNIGEGGESAIVREGDKIEGVFIELVLTFPKPLEIEFTKAEKEAVEKALSEDSDTDKA